MSPAALKPVPSLAKVVKAPLRLPRFVFIHAPPADPHAIALSQAIADRDSSVGLFDFEEPLRRATMEIFCGGFDINLDLTNAEARKKNTNTPGFGHCAFGDWLVVLDRLLKEWQGDAIKANIAIADYERTGGPDFGIYEHFLWRDASHAEANVFAARYGADKCCSIFFSRLTDKLPSGRVVWLATPGVESQMAQLEREFNS
jgi:hypothetical protein